jgi:hypothetical protein
MVFNMRWRQQHEPDDAGVHDGRGGHCGRCRDGDAQPTGSDQTEVTETPAHAERRGLAWVVGAFLICPCHLPLTLALAATLLAGTAVGAIVLGHPLVVGMIVTLAWGAATWHGIRLLRSAGG